MEFGHWVTLGVFIATQIISMIGVVISTRMDLKHLQFNLTGLQAEMENFQKEMQKFGNILVTLADFKGEMNRIQDRQLAYGQRLDEFVKLSNERQKEIWDKLDKLSDAR